MNFLEQANKGEGNAGTYILTIVIALLSLVVGQFVVEGLANSVLGFSMLNIPKNVDLNLILSLMLIPFSFVLIALMFCVRYLHKRPILSVFTSRKTFDWKRLIFAFATWGGIMSISLIYAVFSGDSIEFQLNWSAFIPLFLVSFFILPIQTTAEEVLFRGYLFQAIGKLFKKGWIAILITGVAFGLLHGANPEVEKIGSILLIFYISTGLFLGIMTQMDGGIELSMGYHAVNNIFASLILTNDWQAFQTDALFVDHAPPTFGVESWLTLLLVQPLLLFIFSKKYKWKDWKKKLF